LENKQYLIAEARREQIINAAVEVLREIGYSLMFGKKLYWLLLH